MAHHSQSILDKKFVDFAKLMNIYVSHFPRHERYALGQEIRRAAYDVYLLIVEGQKRYHKKTTLTNLDIRHDQLRMLLRLANEMGYFRFKDGRDSDVAPEKLAEHRYLAITRLVDELGRMVGGWIASEKGSGRESS